jgi:hypothetical protein
LRTLVDSEKRSMSAVKLLARALSVTLILANRWIRSSLARVVQRREHDGGGGSSVRTRIIST